MVQMQDSQPFVRPCFVFQGPEETAQLAGAQHVCVAFGGLDGLEACLARDR